MTSNSPTEERQQWEYKVSFSFTTFDTRRSMATGRNGSIHIYTTAPKEQLDPGEVKQICVNEVLRIKPKWNILMLDVKEISPVKSKSTKP